MYLLSELVLSLPFAAYAYIRVMAVLKRTATRLLFTAVFAALLAGYPVAETLSHRGVSGWTRTVMIAGYYLLPLFLYLVMTVILSDLVIAAARGLKLLSREAVRGPRIRRVRLAVALLLPVLVVGAGIANYRHIRVREFTVEVPRRAASLDGLTIVFAADLHLGVITAGDFMERFVDKVNAASPDLVLIGGDVLEGHGERAGKDGFEAQFRRLHPKYGVYAVPGNHEGHNGRGTDFFERAGIRMLEDEVVRIDGAVRLAGRKDAHIRGRLSVAELLHGVPDDLPIILLDHRPTDLDDIAEAGVDIQLSGHTHYGQLFPVNWLTDLEYELSWGHIRRGRTEVFVTSGVQTWGPPVRTAGYSEILLLRLRFR